MLYDSHVLGTTLFFHRKENGMFLYTVGALALLVAGLTLLWIGSANKRSTMTSTLLVILGFLCCVAGLTLIAMDPFFHPVIFRRMCM